MSVAAEFDWSKEVNQVITKSLVTTFGLDFLLLEDKKGGDVDTVHNVRQGVWATEKEKQVYDKKGDYKPIKLDEFGNPELDKKGKPKRVDIYRNSVYKKRGQKDDLQRDTSQLKDLYRNKDMKFGEDRQLDHIISASQIHHDAGRVLAEKDGVRLANKDENLTSTHRYINNIKNAHAPEKFFNDVVPKKIEQQKLDMNKKQNRLDSLPDSTPEQKDKRRRLENEINDHRKNIEVLESIDHKSASATVKTARDSYEKEINSYYTSSKFFKSSLKAAGNAGLRMGMRESLGVIFAEIWFELKEQIPAIYKKYKQIEFKIKDFFNDLKDTLLNIIERVKLRFKDLISSFRDGAISGVFASLTTTILNIFLTTTKFWGKIIRETWLNIVGIIKLIFFNPENLSTGELTKASFKILSTSIGILVGVITNESLVILKTIPFGDQISIFLSSLASGIVILGLNYFIEQSPVMQKLWAYLDQFKTKYENAYEHFKEINAELDRYVLELTQLEFAINVEDMQIFASQLQQGSNELERNIVLKHQIEKQDIKLPFEMGNNDNTKSWLLGLAKK